LVTAESSLAELFDQCFADLGVFRFPFSEAKNALPTVTFESEHDHHRRTDVVDSIDENDRESEPVEATLTHLLIFTSLGFRSGNRS
jgi:hypothetical protein